MQSVIKCDLIKLMFSVAVDLQIYKFIYIYIYVCRYKYFDIFIFLDCSGWMCVCVCVCEVECWIYFTTSDWQSFQWKRHHRSSIFQLGSIYCKVLYYSFIGLATVFQQQQQYNNNNNNNNYTEKNNNFSTQTDNQQSNCSYLKHL